MNNVYPLTGSVTVTKFTSPPVTETFSNEYEMKSFYLGQVSAYDLIVALEARATQEFMFNHFLIKRLREYTDRVISETVSTVLQQM